MCKLLAQIDVAFGPIGELIAACKFKQALGEVMALARDVNKYLDEKAPWFADQDRPGAHGTTMYVALRAIDRLKMLFAPFLPFTCQRLHRMLGYSGRSAGQANRARVRRSPRASTRR